jgi:hypothetical protein
MWALHEWPDTSIRIEDPYNNILSDSYNFVMKPIHGVYVTAYFSREKFHNSSLLTLLLVSSWLPQIPSLTDVRRGPSSSELGAILSLCTGESLQPK